MKIIVSHDVDHIFAWDHSADLVIPKFLIRSAIELKLHYITWSEFFGRTRSLITNKWQNIEELTCFDMENGIPSTFFLAVNKGRGLSYSEEAIKYWCKFILDKGLLVGLHTIKYRNYWDVKRECDAFVEIIGDLNFGVRSHGLAKNNDTLKLYEKVGYLFDSTAYEFENPHKVGELWEFPLHIMDSYLINKSGRWQNQSLEDVQDATKKMLEKVDSNNIKYLTILSHDRFFCNEFLTWRDWYIWMMNYLIDNDLSFIDYNGAIKELEQSS